MPQAAPSAPVAPATPAAAPAANAAPAAPKAPAAAAKAPVQAEKPAAPADAATATPAAPAEAPKAEPTPELRKQFAAMAREEARIQSLRDQAKREAADLEPLRELKKLLDGDKYAALDKLGIDINEWAKRKVNGGKETAEQRIERLEKERAEERRQREEQDKQSAAKAQQAKEAEIRSNLIAEIDKVVQDGGEKYAFIQAKSASEIVYEVIEENWRRTGRVMEFDEACDLVEAQFEEDALKLTSVPKLKAKLSAQAAATTEATAPAQATKPDTSSGAKPKQPQTLTQNLASTAPDRVEGRLSQDELKKRFRARLRGAEG